MRIKKRFIFDEETEAERIIATGFEDNKINYGEIYLVAKYFREKEGLGEVTLEKRLLEFCKQQDKNFNPVKNANEIKKWVKSALNYNLRNVKEITVSQKDIEFLRSVEYNRDRKILFMILVFVKGLKVANTRRKKGDYKKSNNYYLGYNNLKDIVRMTELSNISETGLARILHKYEEHFLFYNPEKELIRVDFVDKTPEKEITIKDLDNPLLAYQEIFGKNMTYCEVCGEEIHKSGKNQKYCKTCSNNKRRERQRNLMRERREN